MVIALRLIYQIYTGMDHPLQFTPTPFSGRTKTVVIQFNLHILYTASPECLQLTETHVEHKIVNPSRGWQSVQRTIFSNLQSITTSR